MVSVSVWEQIMEWWNLVITGLTNIQYRTVLRFVWLTWSLKKFIRSLVKATGVRRASQYPEATIFHHEHH